MVSPQTVRGTAARQSGRSNIAAGGQSVSQSGPQGSCAFSGALQAVCLSLAAASARIIDTAFDELAKRWKPILDAFDSAGVDLCFNCTPAKISMTGSVSGCFGPQGGHKRCNILFDQVICSSATRLPDFIDIYHPRIKMFHEGRRIRPSGRRTFTAITALISPGPVPVPGDGQLILQRLLKREYDFDRWAVLEWECCIKNSEQVRRRSTVHRSPHPGAERAFDDFARSDRYRRTAEYWAYEIGNTEPIESPRANRAPAPRHGRRRSWRVHRYGASHCCASDDRYELAAAALSSNAEKSAW
jgi:hypothetical protein